MSKNELVSLATIQEVSEQVENPRKKRSTGLTDEDINKFLKKLVREIKEILISENMIISPMGN